MTAQIDFSFSSPIFSTTISGFNEKQATLVQHVLDYQAAHPEGITSSNYEGWHSERNVHLNSAPIAQWFNRQIGRAATSFIRQLSTDSNGSEVMIKECWYNLHGKGGWNMPHVHPAWWSGVLYVSGDFDYDGGDIMFFNPVAESINKGSPRNKTIKPSAGLMLLFPGYLSHMVTPYKAEEPRITISFNIDPAASPQ